MTPDQFVYLKQRLDGLQALIQAQQQWLVLVLAQQRTLLGAIDLKVNDRPDWRPEHERRKDSLAALQKQLEQSYAELLHSAQNQIRLLEMEN